MLGRFGVGYAGVRAGEFTARREREEEDES